jgi:MFS transporter, DHA2 family, multidrug resistance protein
MANAERPPPLHGTALVVLTVALALATFMNVLDTTITNVAIPTIAGGLSVSPNQGTWVITAFVVATAIAVPLTGWLGQRFGEARLFVSCTALFTALSWLCGLADGFSALLLLRVLQGAAAGPMIPLSLSLMLNNYPPEKRGTALTIWGMTTVVAPALGPILGGWITDNYDWPWIFFINVPVGIVAAAIAWTMLKGRETPRCAKPVDIVGLGLLIAWVAALQILLDNGNDMGWFDSNVIVALACIALAAFVLFLIWESNTPHPVVDLTLFRVRNFSVAVTVVTLGFGTYFGAIVIFPLWLQTQMGYTAAWAGIAAAPPGLLAVVFSPIVGRTLNRIDLRLFVTTSFVLFALSSFWFARIDTQATLFDMIETRILVGIGLATFFIPLSAISLSGLPPQRIASASGLSGFLRMLGTSFGTSLSVALWDRRATLHDSRLSEHFTNANPATAQAYAQLQHVGLSSAQAAETLVHVVSQQAFMLATNDFFWLSGWIFVVLLGVVWFARPPFSPKGQTPTSIKPDRNHIEPASS